MHGLVNVEEVDCCIITSISGSVLPIVQCVPVLVPVLI